MSFKVVPVIPTLIGAPARGFAVTGVSTTPETIVVTGTESVLHTMQVATTAAIEVGGAHGDLTERGALVLPKGSGAPPGKQQLSRT
jgi:hypothetical protein